MNGRKTMEERDRDRKRERKKEEGERVREAEKHRPIEMVIWSLSPEKPSTVCHMNLSSIVRKLHSFEIVKNINRTINSKLKNH